MHHKSTLVPSKKRVTLPDSLLLLLLFSLFLCILFVAKSSRTLLQGDGNEDKTFPPIIVRVPSHLPRPQDYTLLLW